MKKNTSIKSKDYLMAFHSACIHLYEECEIGRQLIIQGYDLEKSNKTLKRLLKKLNKPDLSNEEFNLLYKKFIDQHEKSLNYMDNTLKAIAENNQSNITNRAEHLKELKTLIDNAD